MGLALHRMTRCGISQSQKVSRWSSSIATWPIEKRIKVTPSRTRPDGGTVTLRSETLNHKDEVVRIQVATLIVPRLPANAGESAARGRQALAAQPERPGGLARDPGRRRDQYDKHRGVPLLLGRFVSPAQIP